MLEDGRELKTKTSLTLPFRDSLPVALYLSNPVDWRGWMDELVEVERKDTDGISRLRGLLSYVCMYRQYDLRVWDVKMGDFSVHEIYSMEDDKKGRHKRITGLSWRQMYSKWPCALPTSLCNVELISKSLSKFEGAINNG